MNDAARRFVQMVADLHPKVVSPHRLLLTHGQDFKWAPLPQGLKYGPMKACYQNAFHLAMARPDDYTYVEGIAVHIIPTEHAWCIDSKGRVVDTTWKAMPGLKGEDDNPEEWEYFGIPIKISYAYRVIQASKVYSVLWNYDADWPMTRDEPREWLAS
jgi:hypothetical protein